jgi:hypothetical protein
MKNKQYSIFKTLVLAIFVIVFIGCNFKKNNEIININVENETNCPKNLLPKDCSISKEMHGNLMIHNMTDKSFEVKIENHNNTFETKRISPGEGWTFKGIVQGKTQVMSKSVIGDEIYEKHPTIMGGSQQIMSITPYGLKLIDSEVPYMYKASEISGCGDFHCNKCSDRNNCSTNNFCGIENCGHKHGTIVCHGGVLFYLRTSNGIIDKDEQPSCYNRAELISTRLNKYMRLMETKNSGYFKVIDANLVFVTEGDNIYDVLTVSDSDLAGYTFRSSQPELSKMSIEAANLNKKMVAKWWSSILNDHFKMMVLNEKPNLTTNTHCGKVLLVMYNKARELVPIGKIPMNVWAKVAKNLSSEEKSKLYLAAQIVPKKFNPSVLE